MTTSSAPTAVLYRMVMHDHICPFGIKARALLQGRGFQVEDHWLTTREQTDAFKAQYGVKTTPQAFIGGSAWVATTICADISV